MIESGLFFFKICVGGLTCYFEL